MEGSRLELTEDARLTLDALNDHGVVTVVMLRGAGVVMPAQAIYALQLAGWPVRQTGSSWRLVDRSERPPTKPAPPPRVRRVARDE